MTTFIGLDPSLAASGLLHTRDGNVWSATVHTRPTQRTEARWEHIIMEVLQRRDPEPGRTFVTMEDRITPDGKPEHGGRGAIETAMDLAELRGVIRIFLFKHGIPVAMVHPSTLKVYGTGNGNADKPRMLAAARGRFGEFTPIDDDNQADAAFLMNMGMDYHGVPLVPMPLTHRRALKSLKGWPGADEFKVDGE